MYIALIQADRNGCKIILNQHLTFTYFLKLVEILQLIFNKMLFILQESIDKKIGYAIYFHLIGQIERLM